MRESSRKDVQEDGPLEEMVEFPDWWWQVMCRVTGRRFDSCPGLYLLSGSGAVAGGGTVISRREGGLLREGFSGRGLMFGDVIGLWMRGTLGLWMREIRFRAMLVILINYSGLCKIKTDCIMMCLCMYAF